MSERGDRWTCKEAGKQNLPRWRRVNISYFASIGFALAVQTERSLRHGGVCKGSNLLDLLSLIKRVPWSAHCQETNNLGDQFMQKLAVQLVRWKQTNFSGAAEIASGSCPCDAGKSD